LSEANVQAVAQICRRLDGIPLALELAAARIRVLSVEQIAERLDDRFRLLAGGSRMAPERQQTLSGAIDWSYDLLSEPERALLRRLSIFVGGWTLEAAEQVGAGTGDVLDLLALLVAKSLVVSEQQPGQAARFRLLESIREYAVDKLARAGEARAARNRHLAYFVTLAERAGPELPRMDLMKWLSRLEHESDNWRAALTWALEQQDAEAALRLTCALQGYWNDTLNGAEGSRWAEAALNLPDSQGPLARSAWRAGALVTAAKLGRDANQTIRRAWMDEAISIYREQGDQAQVAAALMELGWVVYSPSNPADALQALDEALGLWLALNDPLGIGVCLLNQAEMLDNADEHVKALATYQRSVPFLRDTGDRRNLLLAQIPIAGQAWLDGDAETARVLMLENLAIAEAMGAKNGARLAHSYLFAIALAQGNYDEARTEALELQKAFGNKRELGGVRVRLGQIEYLQGHLAEARAYFEAGLEVFRELNDRNGLGWTPPWLGCVAYREGNLEQAREYIDAGLAIHDPDEYWVELAFALLARGDVARAQGELANAARLYGRSLKMIVDHGMRPSVAEYLEAFAKLALAGEVPRRAARLLGAAAKLRDEIGTPVPAVEQADYDQALASARDQLGPAAFEAAWAEGRAMNWEQAAAHALGK
jgi:tetratricopeptide (TPR) repeat protein